MSTDLNVNFLGIRMKTPIIAASGTFGFGGERWQPSCSVD